MVYELKKSEQLVIFHVPYCLMSEPFYNNKKKGSADQFDAANQSLLF